MENGEWVARVRDKREASLPHELSQLAWAFSAEAGAANLRQSATEGG
jgi:hypothetical protein